MSAIPIRSHCQVAERFFLLRGLQVLRATVRPPRHERGEAAFGCGILREHPRVDRLSRHHQNCWRDRGSLQLGKLGLVMTPAHAGKTGRSRSVDSVNMHDNAKPELLKEDQRRPAIAQAQTRDQDEGLVSRAVFCAALQQERVALIGGVRREPAQLEFVVMRSNQAFRSSPAFERWLGETVDTVFREPDRAPISAHVVECEAEQGRVVWPRCEKRIRRVPDHQRRRSGFRTWEMFDPDAGLVVVKGHHASP